LRGLRVLFIFGLAPALPRSVHGIARNSQITGGMRISGVARGTATCLGGVFTGWLGVCLPITGLTGGALHLSWYPEQRLGVSPCRWLPHRKLCALLTHPAPRHAQFDIPCRQIRPDVASASDSNPSAHRRQSSLPQNQRHHTLLSAGRLDGDFNVLAEGCEKVHKALDREVAGLPAHEAGNVGLLDA